MKNKFEHILLSILLGLSVLLGLSFWLNTVFGFNMFNMEHWEELSRLQAEQIPISNGFYVSISVAIFIFVFGLCFIYVPAIKRAYKKTSIESLPPPPEPILIAPKEEKAVAPKEPPKIILPLSRPPRLNIPSNSANLARQKYEAPRFEQPKPQIDSHEKYDSILSEIFTKNGYVVKKNLIMSNFTSNLLAIAPEEILWIGSVDSDISKLQSAVERLQSVFRETLEDIRINVNAFMLDTTGQNVATDSVLVFKSVDDLKKFISELPPVQSKDMTNTEQENFYAYSEYIDTILQYMKNIG